MKPSVLVWRCVVSFGVPVSFERMLNDGRVLEICIKYHERLSAVIEKLVKHGYLATNSERGRKAQWWFGPFNHPPHGETRPTPWVGQIHAVAGPRMDIPTEVWIEPQKPLTDRAEGLDFLQCPSRRGNRLYFRDGRVTEVD